MTTPLDIVILAAGQGTRMKSATTKVLHALAGRPLLQHVIDTAASLQADRLIVVIGHDAEAISAAMPDTGAEWVVQAEQLGTGHAVKQAADRLDPLGTTLVLFGDVPLVPAERLAALVDTARQGKLAILTVVLDDPTGYGRIVRDDSGSVCAIVEQRDASEAQAAIREINSGIMAVPSKRLCGWLQELDNDNAQGEYYLTDIVAVAVAAGVTVQTESVTRAYQVSGVNSRAQLAELERSYQRQQAERLMDNGISFADPARFDLRGVLQHGRDIFIDINVVLEGDVLLGDDVRIGAGCVIRDSSIDAGTEILPNSVIDGAQLGANCTVGPFARLRPGTRLAEAARIGNFVETKKASIGPGSKVNHLSYLGDATLGSAVNVGAGTITCNYDGVNKYHTTIDDGAFIGSNTALVAPVQVGRDATVAAGSVVTTPVPDAALAVARGRQRNIEGWQRPTKQTARDK